MGSLTFDFAPDFRVATEIAPDEQRATTFNGWDFTAKPAVPYRPKFRVKLGGMRWYLTGSALDTTTNPTLNAGRLLNFYKAHRLWDDFAFAHEYLGTIRCRFAEPLNIPEALPSAGGLCPEFELVLLHHNPGY